MRIYSVSPNHNSPAIRTKVPFTSYGPMGPRERARDYAFRFAAADESMKHTAITVARYLGLPREPILEVWAAIGSLRNAARRKAAA